MEGGQIASPQELSSVQHDAGRSTSESLAGRPSSCDDTAGREGERRVNANEPCSIGGVLYIVVPYCNDGAKSPHPKPAMPAAVLHGCTSILGSGRVARAAEVAAMLS